MIRRQFAAVEVGDTTHFVHVIAHGTSPAQVDITQTRECLYLSAPLTPEQARELARALEEAAAACERIEITRLAEGIRQAAKSSGAHAVTYLRG